MIYASVYPEKFEGDKGDKLMQVIIESISLPAFLNNSSSLVWYFYFYIAYYHSYCTIVLLMLKYFSIDRKIQNLEYSIPCQYD